MKPDSVIRLHVPKRHQVVVYIWPTLEDMRARIKTIGYDEDGADSAYGFFWAPTTRVKLGRYNVVRRKVVAQIHMAKTHVGAGVFAHELQHFVSWWAWIKGYQPAHKDWERVPYLVQRMTTSFWIKYYDRYTDVPHA